MSELVSSSWQHQTHRRAMIVFDQLRAALSAAPDNAARDAFMVHPDNPYLTLLDRLYGEDFQIGRLLDLSDLIVHAEGPDLADPMPALRATSWLCETANRHLRRLAVATFDLSDGDKRRTASAINLRLSGLAPGSLYAGFRLLPTDDGGLFEATPDPAFDLAREAIRSLAIVPGYIDDERVLATLAEEIPDPALRDASLMTAFHLAPTGKLGVHTLGLSVPGSPAGELGQRERVVLRDALRSPFMVDSKPGTFVGDVRELDMDKTRFHLRGVQGIGALRCVLRGTPTVSAVKQWMGETVSVTGRYAVDAQGRPRLLVVDSLDSIQVQRRPKQTELEV